MASIRLPLVVAGRLRAMRSMALLVPGLEHSTSASTIKGSGSSSASSSCLMALGAASTGASWSGIVGSGKAPGASQFSSKAGVEDSNDALAGLMNLTASFIEDEPRDEGPKEGPRALYLKGLRDGLYRMDDRQDATMHMLQTVFEDLRVQNPRKKKAGSGLTVVDTATPQESTPWWASILGGAEAEGPGSLQPATKGLYVFGGVGCGKTMMMDLLHTSAPKEFKPLRMHFHDFMLDVHARLRTVQKSQDPLLQVADEIASGTQLMCLDEFFVTDVADAMILARLFGRLWERNVVLVATSNRHPDDLYKNGLQRQLFLPFIKRLQESCAVHDMESPIDYRRLANSQQGTYFIGHTAKQDLQARIEELTMGEKAKEVTVDVQMGRKFRIPWAAGCVAKFDFRDLCDQALGAADYIALCNAFHTIAISGIPVFSNETKSSGYRFVTFMDIAYEHRCRTLISAEGPPHDLFHRVFGHIESKEAMKDGLVPEDEMVVDDNLGFTKDRTVSRLIDMQSEEYLEQHAEQRAPQLLLALKEKPPKR